MTSMVLENVRVDFPIYGTQRNLRTALFERATGGLIQREGKRQERVVVKALVDISLKLEEGDRLALIGHNGSGKSTLLKVMAGIYEPIAGRILVDGRVTPLFDMMPGLDMEDNAYENIFTAGLLLGMSRKQIERKIPLIEEFCELGEYLSLPIRTYSAGMVTRLGFALSTALDPGILLMDEGIGAGDARFAERAAKRLNDFLGRSNIIVLASHMAPLLKLLCNKGALMEAGRIVALGTIDEVFDKYYESIHGSLPQPALPGTQEKISGASAQVQISVARAEVKQDWVRAEFIPATPLANQFAQYLGGRIETLDGAVCGCPSIHQPFKVCLRYALLKDSPFTMIPNFHFIDWKGETLLVSSPLEAPIEQGDYVASCIIDPFLFNAGQYSVALALSSSELADPVHFYVEELRFEVIEPRGVDLRDGMVSEHDIPGASPHPLGLADCKGSVVYMLEFESLSLSGAYRIRMIPLADDRGFFVRRFCAETFRSRGLETDFVQRSVSYNARRGTLRGLHFQAPPAVETKIVRCTRGAVFDVIVDLRADSPTYGDWHGEEISADNRLMLYIPRGFAHGFQTLTDHTEVDYEITPAYEPNAARGIRFDDPALAIDWPVPQLIISPRDTNLAKMKNIEPM